MRVIIDTNVLISGIFFGGKPGKIFKAWRDGKLRLVISPEIFREYNEVCSRLHQEFPNIDVTLILDAIMQEAELVVAEPLSEQICSDPDDDKFLACAKASFCSHVITGDAALLEVREFGKAKILSPAEFCSEFL